MLLPLLMNLDMFTSGLVEETDTHDGGWLSEEELRRRRLARTKADEEELQAKKEARERLREQIRLAIDGPMEEEVIEAVLPHMEEGKPFTPELHYIDWEAMLRDVEAVERIRMAAYLARERQLQEEDDEEVLLLT